MPQHVERHFTGDATVAACNISPTPGPLKVAPTTTCRPRDADAVDPGARE
jgi:hypothetical protein